jgi:hypothetical protein
MADVYIGIDPDAVKSGVGVVKRATREVDVKQLAFASLVAFIRLQYHRAEVQGKTIMVIVEGGWLIHGNWHIPFRCSTAKAAAIGRSVGMNHQTGLLLVEILKAEGIPVQVQRPLRKMWQGADGKITSAELAEITGKEKLPRCNQEGRDALLIAWVASGLPVRVRPTKR